MAGPLTGLRILDFTTLLPGPYATMVLADLGAEVLRVVSGSRPDLASFLPPFIPGTELSAAAACLGRGKRSLGLDLKDPRAGEIIRRLVLRHDIVLESFRPGVMAKFGLDYDSLRGANPALIYCSLTGYGQQGPQANRAGHDINFLARSGVMARSGRREGGPAPIGIQLADVASGSNHAVIAILAAVIDRQRTGEGQRLDVSMADGVLAIGALDAACYLLDGVEPGFESGYLNGGSLYDFYETADGRHLAFGGLEHPFFGAFCETIGRPDLIAGGIAPPELARVKGEIRAILKTRTLAEWMRRFAEVDACVEPVLSLGEAIAESEGRSRGMVVEVPLPDGRTIRQLGHPVRYSRSQPECRSAGCMAGAHTREVLGELGYGDAEIDELERSGLFR